MPRRLRVRRVVKWAATTVFALVAGMLLTSYYVSIAWANSTQSCGFLLSAGQVWAAGVLEPTTERAPWPAGWGLWLTRHLNPRSSALPALWGDDIVIPLWFPLLLGWVPTALLWYLERRHLPGHCPRCGYNLTGNLSGRCPECGAAVPRITPTPPVLPAPAPQTPSRK